MENNAWKVVLIVIAGVIAVGLMAVFGIQGTQNKAIVLNSTISMKLRLLQLLWKNVDPRVILRMSPQRSQQCQRLIQS